MRVASFISQITEPMFLIIVLTLVGVWSSGVRGAAFMWFVLFLSVLSLLIVYARIRFMKKFKTNWDVSDRKKRVPLLLLLIGFYSVLIFSLSFTGNPMLVSMSVLFLVWLIGFFFITLKLKISGHVAVGTFVVGNVVQWFGLSYTPLFVLIPVVGWSRLALKRHTLVEVIGGTLYSIGILLIFSRVFN